VQQNWNLKLLLEKSWDKKFYLPLKIEENLRIWEFANGV